MHLIMAFLEELSRGRSVIWESMMWGHISGFASGVKLYYTKSFSGYNESNFNLKGHALQQLEEALSDICHKWDCTKTFSKESRHIYNNKDSVLLALEQFSQSQVALRVKCSYS